MQSRRFIIRSLAALMTALVGAVGPVRAQSPGLSIEARVPPAFSNIKGVSDERMAKLLDGFFLATKVDGRSANDLGWDCLAAIELHRRGDRRAVERLAQIAAALAKQVVIDPRSSKAKGWGAEIVDSRCKAGGYDAFGDGSCNPVDTVYAFQSGLGVACLAYAAKAMQEAKYLSLAREAADYWQQQTLPSTLCGDCIYFATSDSRNDSGRYVRNMNVFMAFGDAMLASTTGEQRYADSASRAMRSEVVERKSGNRGYLGRLDPEWKKKPAESERIENHSAGVAVVSLSVSRLLSSPEIREHAKTVWRDWATCENERCVKGGCKYWAGDAHQCQSTHTGAHCAFRAEDALAAAQCSAYVEAISRYPSFGIWSAAVGADGR